MKTGVYPNHARDRYDAFGAVNWSTLKMLKRSPAHYQEALANPPKQTPAMRGGNAFHVATLEPDRFESEFIVMPDFGNCTKADNKARRNAWWGEVSGMDLSTVAEWESWLATGAGPAIIEASEREAVLRMGDAVRANQLAMRYLESGNAEVSMVWERCGLTCKGRVDFLSRSDPAIVDIKRAKDIERSRFMRQAFSLGYHNQMAFYRDGHKRATGQLPLPCIVIAVEPERPHDVAVYRYDEDALHYGDEECEELLRHLDYCRKRNQWPGMYETELSLTLPAWVMGDDDDDMRGAGISFGKSTAAE